MKTKFKVTQQRNNTLVNWLIEERENMNSLIKNRMKIVVKGYNEKDESYMLNLNSQSYKESKEMIDFCLENIRIELLDKEQTEIVKSFQSSYIDDTNYMM
jgi:hypothetical protein